MKALGRRRFRLVLLVLIGFPIIASHLAATLGAALLDHSYRATDFSVYFGGAQALAAGRDPYASFLSSRIGDPTLNLGYIYPPLLAWALQPLVPLGLHTAVVVAELAEHACLIAFALLLRPVLAIRNWEATAWIYVLAAAWFPVRENLYGAQVNVLLLLLVTLWLTLSTRAGGAVPLGISFAIKFLTAPALAYLALRRRGTALAVALVTIAMLWALAEPRWLPEYLTRVLPRLGSGSGFRENIAPSGTLIRIFQPASFYGQSGSPALVARVLTLAVSLAVVALTAWRLGSKPRAGRDGLAREVSAVIAASPLIATLTWPSHAVLLLLPVTILLADGIRRGDRRLVFLVAAGVLMLGPVRSSELALIAAGVHAAIVLRPLAETGVVGMGLIYLASLLALDRGPRAIGALVAQADWRAEQGSSPA